MGNAKSPYKLGFFEQSTEARYALLIMTHRVPPDTVSRPHLRVRAGYSDDMKGSKQ